MSNVKMLVLDEGKAEYKNNILIQINHKLKWKWKGIYILVDKMLDMGHMPDIKNLFHNLPSSQMAQKGEKNHMQVMMYTATLMPKIMTLVGRFD